jgi:hypothetical protein
MHGWTYYTNDHDDAIGTARATVKAHGRDSRGVGFAAHITAFDGPKVTR